MARNRDWCGPGRMLVSLRVKSGRFRSLWRAQYWRMASEQSERDRTMAEEASTRSECCSCCSKFMAGHPHVGHMSRYSKFQTKVLFTGPRQGRVIHFGAELGNSWQSLVVVVVALQPLTSLRSWRTVQSVRDETVIIRRWNNQPFLGYCHWRIDRSPALIKNWEAGRGLVRSSPSNIPLQWHAIHLLHFQLHSLTSSLLHSIPQDPFSGLTKLRDSFIPRNAVPPRNTVLSLMPTYVPFGNPVSCKTKDI